MRKIIYTILFIIVIAGCDKSTLPLPGGIQLRIHNATGFNIQDCIIDQPGDPVSDPGPDPFNYGSVGANKKTGYKPFETAYRYCSINLIMNGKSYSFQPYDYVSELPLSAGRYTYKLTYLSPNDQLHLELIKD